MELQLNDFEYICAFVSLYVIPVLWLNVSDNESDNVFILANGPYLKIMEEPKQVSSFKSWILRYNKA